MLKIPALSRSSFLKVAGTVAGASVFGSGIAVDSAALAPECAAPVSSQSDYGFMTLFDYL